MDNANLKQLEIELPERIEKRQKSYYIPKDVIEFLKKEAERLGASENDVLTGVVNFYRVNTSR